MRYLIICTLYDFMLFSCINLVNEEEDKVCIIMRDSWIILKVRNIIVKLNVYTQHQMVGDKMYLYM
jgi:hypothetical protein